MPCVLLGETLTLEDVAEVGAAGGADDLGAHTVGVTVAFHSAGDLIIEARPATVGMKLVL